MTSVEMVKVLRCCATVDGVGCYECPAKDIELKSELDCYVLMKTEAADLIERLEKEKAALLEHVKMGCANCKNRENGIDGCKNHLNCQQCSEECRCRGCASSEHWEWKGLEDKK